MKAKLLSVLMILPTSMSAVSQENVADTTGCGVGWLWEISGNGLQQKSYLFGTCHGEGHNFTREELLGINGLDNALNDVKAVLFEGGMNTEISKADSAAIISEVENTMKKLAHPGAEYMMPEGTYYKPLFDTVAHFNEVNKFLYYKMNQRTTTTTKSKVLTSLAFAVAACLMAIHSTKGFHVWA